MGTSSRHNGPKDRNPLLPEGYSPKDYPSEENDKNIDEKPFKWENAKRQMSKYLNNNTSLETATKSYVKALGGAKKATTTAKVGKEVTISLGKFLSSINNSSIESTLNSYNIPFFNRDIKDVLTDVINILSPIPKTKEEATANEAVVKTIEILYETIEENGGDLSILNNLSTEYYNNILENFIGEFIFDRLMTDLSSRSEISTQDISKIQALELDLKGYIDDKVNYVLKDKNLIQNNFFSKEIKDIIEGIYREAYSALEGELEL